MFSVNGFYNESVGNNNHTFVQNFEQLLHKTMQIKFSCDCVNYNREKRILRSIEYVAIWLGTILNWQPL